MERALVDLQATSPAVSVLTMIAAHPGVSNADLARLTLLMQQTVGVRLVHVASANTDQG